MLPRMEQVWLIVHLKGRDIIGEIGRILAKTTPSCLSIM